MAGTDAKPLGAERDADSVPPDDRQRRRLRPSRRAVLLTLVALTLLTAGGTWTVYGSPWLRATRVSVTGNHQLTDARIVKAAAVPLGGPLESVDTGAVRRRLLAALPRIGAVAVTRSWPHTVTVTVTERTAAAVIRDGAHFTEVDRDGVRFAGVARPPHGVPLVQLAPDRATAAASLRQFGTEDLLRAAITVAGDLPAAVRAEATVIRVRSYDGISVQLTGGREVMWGSAQQGPLKAAVLTALMKAEPHAGRFDISAPTAPAVSES